MNECRGVSIGIIGAGFSGTLLALHLLRRAGPDDRIHLIERGERLGGGLAFSSGNPNHLLNVRAGNMSAFADRPNDFVDWLRQSPAAANLPEPAGPSSFVQRGLYGAYVQHLLGAGIWREGGGHILYPVNDEAVRIHPEFSGWSIELAVGRRIAVDIAVVAIGNFPPSQLNGRVIGDPWSPAALDGLRPSDPVLILGTGLSMIDTVVSLLDRGHTGKIHALSRRGLLPRQHASGPAIPRPLPYDPPPSGASLRKLLRRVREAASEAAAKTGDWRIAIDGLRPHTQRLWHELSPADRARFLRHLRPWWDVHRHRAAPAVMARIESALAAGQLVQHVGRLAGFEEDADGLTARYRAKGKDVEQSLRIERAVDCTGPRTDCNTVADALLRGLIADGLAVPDRLGLGLDIARDGALIGRDGRAQRGLYAVGPITRGAHWEIVAVPDLRIACESLAAHLMPDSAANAVPLSARRS